MTTHPHLTPPADTAAARTAGVFPRVRWMGSKYRLLPHLADVFEEVEGTTALDAFSGSGVVSYLLKQQGYAVHANDYLEFPGHVARATVINQREVLSDDDIAQLTGPAADGRDFIRRTFGGVFFKPADLAFLDSAWSHIDQLSGAKRSLAISALCLSAARKQPRGVFTISGDLSHYDDGRRDLQMSMREHFSLRAGAYNAAVFDGPIGHVSSLEATHLPEASYNLVYLDPPYAPPTDDNDYIKRFHFLEGLSRYWVGNMIMENTKSRKIPKRITPFSHKNTIIDGFRDVFKKFHDSTIVLSYSSNALPDRDTLVALLREYKPDVEVRAVPHTYHYGTHSRAVRRQVSEYIFIGR